MRKLTVLLSLTLIIALIAGCSNSGASGGRTAEERAAVHIDVDLSVLSSTVLAAEMVKLYSNKDDYIGKMVRIRGDYNSMFIDYTGRDHHFVITLEGDSCCPDEGLEFVWNGDHKFPDDYPQLGTTIEVEGILSTYEAYGTQIIFLSVDDIFVID